ncbi:hypothetical protein D3C74_293510 [compost metagenome]
MGRFISKDTYEGSISNPLSLILYTYVENKPLNNVDPSGFWCQSTVNGKTYSHAGGCSDPANYDRYVPDKIVANNPGKSYEQLISLYKSEQLTATLLAKGLGNGVKKEFENTFGDFLPGMMIGSTVAAPAPKTMPVPGAGVLKGAVAIITAIIGATTTTAETTTTVDLKYQFIFRNGSGNKTNLTPRPGIDTNGLSYFLKPKGSPMTVTSIEAINSTGVLYARVDNPATGHVAVMPIDPFELEIWMATRNDPTAEPYYLTTVLQSISIKLK